MVTVGLQCLPTVLVVVNRSLLLLIDTRATAVSVNQGLGNIGFGPKTSKIRDGGSQGAAGGPGVEVDVHVRGNACTCSVFCVGRGFFVSHTQLVQFFKMLAKPARGAHFQVVWVRWPPGSDDSAVLCEVDVPVDVTVAVGDSVALGLRGALLSCGAGLILPIYHQLNPLLFPRLRKTEGITVNIQVFFQKVQYMQVSPKTKANRNTADSWFVHEESKFSP